MLTPNFVYCDNVFVFVSFSGWIEETNLKTYLEFKETLIKGNKSGGFKDAVEAIEKYRLVKGEVSNIIEVNSYK